MLCLEGLPSFLLSVISVYCERKKKGKEEKNDSVKTDINCYHFIAKERRKVVPNIFHFFPFHSHSRLLMLTPPAVDKQPYEPPQDETAINKL
jgi:hypothetical protein